MFLFFRKPGSLRWKPAMEGGELSLGIKNPETNKTCTTKALGEQQRQKSKISHRREYRLEGKVQDDDDNVS